LFLGSVIISALSLLVACSPLKTLNAVIPDNDYMVTKDIAYGELPRQKLDVYVPRMPKPNVVATQDKRPVVVFFYGGRWESGNRVDYKFVAEALTSQGFIAIIPDYRIYPEVLFPGFMADPASAAKWAKQHAAEYGGDPQRIFLVGHSAGAHIAVMLSLNNEYLAVQGLKPADFRGTIGMAGAYDFLPLKKERMKIIFGPEQDRWKSQPINFVTGSNSPMLLVVGKQDTLVWPKNTYNLAAKIKAAGGPVEVVEYPDLGHIDLIAKLARPFRGDGELLQAMAEFIRSH
jgi:acetyl esterase/lipase